MVSFSNTASLDKAGTAENGGSSIYPTLHPSIFLVLAQVTMVGAVVSFTLIVWLHVDVFPHASPMVHVLITTVGHVPAATSIYITVVIPHASDAFPRFVAFSNTASLEIAVVAEYAGPVMASTLHPSIVLVTAHAVIVGAMVSSTLIV